MTVASLMESISYQEFIGWVQFYEEEPFGEFREDWRMGQIASTIANTAPHKRGRKTYKPKDFMWKKPKKTKQSLREMFEEIKKLNSDLGGNVVRRVRMEEIE
jgi:hypothetical protein